MKINIDVHILKKVVHYLEQIDREIALVERHRVKAVGYFAEIKALLEFIEGECDNNGGDKCQT